MPVLSHPQSVSPILGADGKPSVRMHLMLQCGPHLQVTVDNGSFALMQAGNGFTGVTKYLEHFILCKTCLQALVHQVDHLASCKGAQSKRELSNVQTHHSPQTMNGCPWRSNLDTGHWLNHNCNPSVSIPRPRFVFLQSRASSNASKPVYFIKYSRHELPS